MKKSVQKQKAIFASLLVAATALAAVIMGPQLWDQSQDLASQAKVENRGNTMIWTRGNQAFKPTLPVEPGPGQPVLPLPSASPTPKPTFYPVPKPTTKPTPTPTPSANIQGTCPEDINYDFSVNQADFDILKADYGKKITEVKVKRSDINRDGVVNLTDFSLLAAAFGRKCGNINPVLPVEPGPGQPVVPIQ